MHKMPLSTLGARGLSCAVSGLGQGDPRNIGWPLADKSRNGLRETSGTQGSPYHTDKKISSEFSGEGRKFCTNSRKKGSIFIFVVTSLLVN